MFETDAPALPRLMNCNGSRLMTTGSTPVVTPDHTARNEGIAAHYMALTAFLKRSTIDEMIDRKAPNGTYMSGDMGEHVANYLKAVDRPYAASRFDEVACYFGNDRWSIRCEPDHSAVTADGTQMWIDDLRYGWSIVEPERNWTLIAHAISLIRRRSSPPPQWIHLTIHQPRARHPLGPVRTWSISHIDLMMYEQLLDQTLSNLNDTLRTGEHCRKCPAVTHCPASTAAGYNAIDASCTAFVETIDNDALSHELDLLKKAAATIKYRLDAYEELATHRVATGQIVTNYSLEPQFSNRRWNDGIDAVMLKALTGKDLTVPKLCTPAEAERRDVPESVVNMYSAAVPIGKKLVRVDASKRAAKLFNGAK